jgi:hypothetical protein
MEMAQRNSFLDAIEKHHRDGNCKVCSKIHGRVYMEGLERWIRELFESGSSQGNGGCETISSIESNTAREAVSSWKKHYTGCQVCRLRDPGPPPPDAAWREYEKKWKDKEH